MALVLLGRWSGCAAVLGPVLFAPRDRVEFTGFVSMMLSQAFHSLHLVLADMHASCLADPEPPPGQAPMLLCFPVWQRAQQRHVGLTTRSQPTSLSEWTCDLTC